MMSCNYCSKAFIETENHAIHGVQIRWPSKLSKLDPYSPNTPIRKVHYRGPCNVSPAGSSIPPTHSAHRDRQNTRRYALAHVSSFPSVRSDRIRPHYSSLSHVRLPSAETGPWLGCSDSGGGGGDDTKKSAGSRTGPDWYPRYRIHRTCPLAHWYPVVSHVFVLVQARRLRSF